MTASYLAIVCNSADNSLSLFDLDAGMGVLTHIRDMPLPDVGEPNGAYPMTLSPDRRRLYVAFRGKPHEVLTYALDAQAENLTLLGRAPLADSMAHIATDSTGKFLLSAAFIGGKLSVNPIDADGIAQSPSDVVDVEPNMHCCIPIPGTDTFFATSLGDDSILKFRFDAAGQLTRLPERAASAAGSGPRHFVLHPKRTFGYLVTQSTSTVDVFGFEGSALTREPLQSLSILPPNWQGDPWAADIHITPDGRFLYASDRKANSIAAFTVDAQSGHLKPSGHTFTAPWPRAFRVTPDGRYLIALGENSALAEVFAIDTSTGGLDKRHALQTGKGPSWVEIVAR